MHSRIGLLVLATALAAAPAAAQDLHTMAMESLLQSLRLPKAAQEARTLGVPEQDLRGIFDMARAKQLPAGSITEVIEVGNTSIREHGPVDNFGAFVQARLDEGLRGRELAAAIRAEHAAHGKGKGYVRGKDGHPEGKGGPGVTPGEGRKPGGTDKVGSPGGKPEGPGRPGERGKPDTTGKAGAAKGKKGGSQ